ncbi:polyadenylate-binding protein 3-like [Anopheles arabiensis]|uniref:polyadenylate-binding protein 3-like n=1 Tax=Anopheles arabiensis TaxID=7173 RepID=UPI001AAD38F4|nr:polyadenylate-binding protein 3-like [Anopheles arabiensis]
MNAYFVSDFFCSASGKQKLNNIMHSYTGDQVRDRSASVVPLPEAFARNKRFCLFLGNISSFYDDRMLGMLLNLYGPFREMICSPPTFPGAVKSAIVVYDQPEPLENAARHLNGAWLAGTRMYAAASFTTTSRPILTSTELHVTNFSEWIDEEVLHELFGRIGRVMQIVMGRSVYGYREAYVSFRSAMDTEEAHLQLNGWDMGDGFTLRVRHSYTVHGGAPVSPAEFQRLQTNRFLGGYVRVSGLGQSFGAVRLRELFGTYGLLRDVSVLRDQHREPLGWAILRYQSDKQALFVSRIMDNSVVDDSRLKVVKLSNQLLPFTDAVPIDLSTAFIPAVATSSAASSLFPRAWLGV